MVDIGGTTAKCMASRQEGLVKIPTGDRFTPQRLMRELHKATKEWRYDVVTLGYPGVVVDGRPAGEPANLGGGWMRFDFRKAFNKPVRIINDAAMQALAGYEKGRMLYLGFGTSVGGALVVDHVVVPLEVGLLRLSSGKTLVEDLDKKVLEKRGQKRWQRRVAAAVTMLREVFQPDDIVLGGGNAKYIDPLPKGCRTTANQDAFRGAVRLWPGADMVATPHGTSWRLAEEAN